MYIYIHVQLVYWIYNNTTGIRIWNDFPFAAGNTKITRWVLTHDSLRAFCAWDLSFSLWHSFYDLDPRWKNSGNAAMPVVTWPLHAIATYAILQHVSHHVALPLSTQIMLSIMVWGEKPSQQSAALAFVHFVHKLNWRRLKLELSNRDSSQTCSGSTLFHSHVPNASLISNTCSRLSIQHDPATALLVRRP